MNIYRSKYLDVNFFEEHQLVEMIWLPSTDDMTEQEYKQEFLNYLDVIRVVRPKKALVDTVNMFFPIAPEAQEWTNLTIFPSILEAGNERVAFLVSREVITQLSIEQTMEESEGAKFLTRYFANQEDAKKWLL